ncbi:hypothetical protein cypCar_00025123 [Cyprinus carpio]|nr:hypothetical protein cypCar_00025123 [Cyprinus carpio]
MCSTFHKAYEGDTVQRKVKGDAHRTLVQVPIPAVVLDYNSYSTKPKHLTVDNASRQKCSLCSQKTPVTCETCAVMCFQLDRKHFNDWHENKCNTVNGIFSVVY